MRDVALAGCSDLEGSMPSWWQQSHIMFFVAPALPTPMCIGLPVAVAVLPGPISTQGVRRESPP
jgi:hypothetical protein